MRGRTLIGAALALAVAAPVRAEKIEREFKNAFEGMFSPHRSYAVVVQKGIPTTSIYGVKGDQTRAHYSIDVIGGRWKTSAGLLDTDQTAADFLDLGEVMELDSISYKDNRVDFRMVSTEAKKVTRGNWLLKDTKPEPVATNFKFFFPFPKSHVMTPADMPAVRRYIGTYLRFFPDQRSARTFSARLIAGGSVAAPAAVPVPRRTTTKKEIKAGMTALEVIEILGKPQKEVTFQSSTKWTYPDLTVIFVNGRVKEVRF